MRAIATGEAAVRAVVYGNGSPLPPVMDVAGETGGEGTGEPRTEDLVDVVVAVGIK